MSISRRERDGSKGRTIDVQNYFENEKEHGRNQNKSESKFVSINQLMKQNQQGAGRLGATLNYKGSEEVLEEDQYQTL